MPWIRYAAKALDKWSFVLQNPATEPVTEESFSFTNESAERQRETAEIFVNDINRVYGCRYN